LLWPSKGYDPEFAAKVLADRGCLARDGRNYAKKMTIPQHGRVRVYVVTGHRLME
jgi:hypothetical protein